MRKLLTITAMLLTTILLCSCKNFYKTKDILSLPETTLEQIEYLENTYNITISYEGKEPKDNLTLEHTLAKDTDKIIKAIEAADVIFGRLPEDWANIIANPDTELEGIRRIDNVCVVLCEELKNEKDAFGTEIEFKGLYEFTEDIMYLYVDVANFDPEIAIAEGIMYRIICKQIKDDDVVAYIMADEIREGTFRINYLYDYYNELNPEGFTYYHYVAEIKDEDKKYLYEDGKSVEDVYFVDEVAMYNELLDCLYTMTPLLYTDKNSELPEVYDSDIIQKKIMYTRVKINYMFDSEEMYWDTWFE